MKKKARRKYSDEFKAEAVKLVTDQAYKTANADQDAQRGMRTNVPGLASRFSDGE